MGFSEQMDLGGGLIRFRECLRNQGAERGSASDKAVFQGIGGELGDTLQV